MTILYILMFILYIEVVILANIVLMFWGEKMVEYMIFNDREEELRRIISGISIPV